MAKIPDNILSKLKCNQCNDYLSCGPVFLINGSEQAVCGRCNRNRPIDATNVSRYPESEGDSGKQRTRCKQYEAVATLLAFPCQNAAYGCPELLTFSAEEQSNHELSCKFTQRECPVLPSGQCDWIGGWNNLLQHCKAHHPDKVLQNECEMEHDITKPSLQTFLISTFNVLFLLHVKFCASSAKIFHSIRLLNDSVRATHYTYILKIKRNDIEFLKPGKILPADCLDIKEGTSLAININNLLDTFRGFNGTKFKITIKQLIFEICQFCSKKVNYQQDTICMDCKSKIHNCANKSRGCVYQDINSINCNTHQIYYCQYVTKCPICPIPLNASILFEHFESGHAAIRAKVGVIWRSRTIMDGNFKYCVISSNVGTLLCEYKLINNSQLELYVHSPLSSAKLRLYRYSIQIVDPQTEHSETFTTNIDYNNCSNWKMIVNLNSFPSYKTIGLDIKLDINTVI